MGTQGYSIVRFRRRYYVRWNQYDSYFEGLGAKIVASIPADPEAYQQWLESMRAEYAALECALEKGVYEIRDGCKPDFSLFREFEVLPSEFLELNVELVNNYVYIINLDCEILTMQHGIHWKLGNIPRHDNLWLRSITDSTYTNACTLSLDLCPEEHMAAPALELPGPDRAIRYNFQIVSPNINIREARKVFLTSVLAITLIQYKHEILSFGREWSPDSFPFRELAFALVSIASGRAGFHSFPAQSCNPRSCSADYCKSKHLPRSPGWLDEQWVGDKAPLLEFGSMSHLPGDPPGVSPAETMYWLGDVLVSLELVTDGAAITKAVTWGIEQGHTNFQIVILSLFKVKFAEVSFQPYLSPIHAHHCMSTHPRNRPEAKPGMWRHLRSCDRILSSYHSGTRQTLQKLFPGFAALVNFFEIAANRHAVSKTRGIFPVELYHRIIDFVDYDTWKTCLAVSTEFRSYCLSKYRLDDRTRIVGGPFICRTGNRGENRLSSFNFENMQTGEILPMTDYFSPRILFTEELNWMPLIGSDRKALMLNVVLQFEPAKDALVEADSNDEP
ncbi:hypothetical protein EV127DRAFT_464848 [Xylaria flabelliformis]|nr:hypothetical protein EV127DRAFT_464848 [Xylaria flabelliformis]